jgi:hypothetical protein
MMGVKKSSRLGVIVGTESIVTNIGLNNGTNPGD